MNNPTFISYNFIRWQNLLFSCVIYLYLGKHPSWRYYSDIHANKISNLSPRSDKLLCKHSYQITCRSQFSFQFLQHLNTFIIKTFSHHIFSRHDFVWRVHFHPVCLHKLFAFTPEWNFHSTSIHWRLSTPDLTSDAQMNFWHFGPSTRAFAHSKQSHEQTPQRSVPCFPHRTCARWETEKTPWRH